MRTTGTPSDLQGSAGQGVPLGREPRKRQPAMEVDPCGGRHHFTRVDSDIVDRLIVKEDQKGEELPHDKQEVLSSLFKGQMPKVKKTEFHVEAHALGENNAPIVITQAEYMRRMKDMASIQPGMSFYGEMPDMFNLVLNSDHRLIKQVLSDAETACAEKLVPVESEIAMLTLRRNELQKAQEGKKDEEIPTAEKDELNDVEKKIEAQKTEKENILNGYATGNKVVRSKEHVALAKAVADESIVLLENKNNILPLDLSRYKSIALLGPNSNYGVAGDYGWVNADHHECVTLFDGLKNALGQKVQMNQLDGCDWWSQKEDGIAAAVELARKSDIAIVAVGTRSLWLGRNAKANKVTSGEGFDLSSLELPGKQLDLLKAVKATGKPVVVVLITGKPLVMTWAKENADAVVLQFYGGEQQGNAMADVLLGKVNPSGRLNVSFPRSTGNTPCYYNYYRTDRETVFDKGGSLDEPNGHYVFDKPYALWNFGYGLSYTDFEYSDFSLNDTVFSANGKLKAKVKVKNTGKRDGKEVVQLYVHDLVASVSQPVQQLKAFKKVEVPAGKEVEVELEMPMEELSFCNEYLKRVVEPGDVEIQIGRASDNIVFRKTIVVK